MKPELGGGSRRQARIVEVLWEQHLEDERLGVPSLISGRELAIRSGVRDPTRDVPMARVKLRRQGWEIESHNGRGGGYRLIRWTE